jgi:hypothetical protein
MRFALLLLLLASPLARAEDCAALSERLSQLDPAKAQPVQATPSTGFADLYRECDEHDSWAGQPLPTFKGLSLKCSTDKNRVEKLLQFPDRTVLFEAKAAVDADGSPVSCGRNHSQTDQCETWLSYDPGSPQKYVDAEQVPFIVVPLDGPKPQRLSLMKTTGIRRGDLAVAMYKGQCAYGVVGDAGPYFRLGEASLATHAALGNPQCKGSETPCTKLVGGGSGRGLPSGVSYLVFPGTRPKPLRSDTLVEVSGKAAKAALEKFLDTWAPAAATTP